MKRFLARLLAATLSLALLAGCGGKPASTSPEKSGGEAPVAKPAPMTVKVGNVNSMLFAPLYIAMDKGYLAEQGITVQLETLQAGQDAIVFLANGQLDFVLAGYSAGLINAAGRGMDVLVIAPMGIQPREGDPSPLVVRADLAETVKSTKDLKGKKIAVPGGMGAAGSFLVASRLAKVGLTLSDVEIVNIGMPEQQAALANKAIDAALMAEPFSTKTITEKTGYAVDKGVLAGTNASGLLTSGIMLKEKPDVVNRFTTALLKAARDIQGDGYKADAHLVIFEKYTKLKPDVILASTPYAFDVNFDLTAPRRDLASFQEIMTKAGVLKLSAPVDIARLVDGGPAAAAVKALGKQ